MGMIENAKSGLKATQLALDITGQNILNSATPGYSRQIVTMTPQHHGNTGSYGVDIQNVRRISDDYNNLVLWQSASNHGYYQVQEAHYDRLEAIQGNPSSSLAVGLTSFTTKLLEASSSADGDIMRTEILQEAKALSARFNTMNNTLKSEQNQINLQVNNTVDQINTLCKSIAELNKSIIGTQGKGGNIFGLQDALEQQVSQLSSLLMVDVTRQPNNTFDITLMNGIPLVSGSTAASLECSYNSGTAQYTLTIDRRTHQQTIPTRQLNGQLGGLFDYQQDTLRALQQQTDALANSFITAVNTVLLAGIDTAGNAGTPLFAGTTAGSMAVVATMTANFLALDNAAQGDKLQLRALIDRIEAQTHVIPLIGTLTFHNAAYQLSGQVASASQQNKISLVSAEDMQLKAKLNRESTSGVDRENEEAVNLLDLQKLYQANMKVIATASRLFDDILAML